MRRFISVDYPGFVENDELALRTLGGIDRIEQTFQRRNRKLFLNFTPDNLFAKSLSSNLIETISKTQNFQPKSSNESKDSLNNDDEHPAEVEYVSYSMSQIDIIHSFTG